MGFFLTHVFFFIDMGLFNVVFHHGGEFAREETLFYRGGVETLITGQDFDLWSYFEAVGLVEGWKYAKSSFRLWRKIEGVDDTFKHILFDDDIKDVGLHAVSTKLDGQIYVEHNVSSNSTKVAEPKCIELIGKEGSGDDDSSEDEAKGIRFDDSEEERTMALDDGFEVVEVEPPANGSNRVEVNGKSYRVKTLANKSPSKGKGKKSQTKGKGKLKLKVPAAARSGSTSQFDKEDEYVSDELDSSDPDASGDEKNPKYEKFRQDQLSKAYQFKLGMEFNSLQEFKDTMREWTVLNGYQMKMEKNDKKRVRVVCKKDCGFVALCSKVGDRHTYQIKTLVGPHTCAITLENKSATSKWVSKDVVKKL